MRVHMAWVPLVGLIIPSLGGCAIFKAPTTRDSASGDGGATGDGGGDTATSTDGGGTSGDGGGGDGGGDGGGSDTGGGDGGGDTGASPLCDQRVVDGPPTQACVTDQLACDTSLVDSLVNGDASFGAEAYQAWTCNWSTDDHWAGRERVYAFHHPGTGTVDIRLDSPCADMNLFVLRWGYFESDGECPTAESTLARSCDFDDSPGGGTISVWDSSESDYLVIVDGVDGAEDNFAISTTCP